jgi:hypothetical protein
MKADFIPAVVRSCFQAQRTPIFLGSPGTAKTAFVHEAARNELAEYIKARDGLEELPHVHVEVLHLASMSEVDVRGYLIPNGDTCLFTKPVYWQAVEKHKYGILFLDEFPQAPHEVQKAVAPLIYEGCMGNYCLDKRNWMVACAGNGTEDNAGANSLLSHVLNRIIYVNVQAPSIERWSMWAGAAGMPPELIAFANLRPSIVFDAPLPKAENEPYCTPRSMETAGLLAHGWPGGLAGLVDRKAPVGMELLVGCVGKGAAAEIAGVVEQMAKLPSFNDICKNPLTVPAPQEPDMAYAAIMLVACRAEWEKHGEAPMQYLLRFNPNLALVGLCTLLNRQKKYMACGSIGQWTRDNEPLLAKMRNFISIKG